MFWKKKTNTLVQAQALSKPEGSMACRSSVEVAGRLLALLAVIGRTHEEPPDRVVEWVGKHEIAKLFSEAEAAYFQSTGPSNDAKVAFSWKAEAAVSLIWGLGGLQAFPALNEQFDIYAVELVREALKAPREFLHTARLRPESELREQEERLYQEHWRVRDAQLFNKPMPAELNPGTVYERRYGLSWMVGWGEDWDDVPTDT